MPKLHVIAVSTRDGRAGFPIVEWTVAQAKAHAGFEVELVDLREVGLPLFDEAHHPRLRKYEHAHTKAWSARVEAADAFVFVTPEYNHGTPPSLVNALDYLVHEWAYKPVGFVSYGGVSAGTRGVQMTKQIVVGLRMVPVVEAVNIPMFTKHITDGVFDGSAQEKPATAMFDELARWTSAMAPLRAP